MTADQSIAALAALAHAHRLAAYRALVEAGPNGLAAGRIANLLAIPPSSLTFHLQQLFRAELITQRRSSRQLIYAANFTTMNALLGYLTENCCGQGERGACAAPLCSADAPSQKTRAATRRRSA